MNRFVVFASVIDEHVKGVLGQEELVSSVINLLTAEVPHIEPKRPTMVADEVLPVDVDAASRFVFPGEFEIRLIQAPQQAGLPRASFAENQHFGFVEKIFTLSRQFAEVIPHGLGALPSNLNSRPHQRTVFDIQAVLVTPAFPTHRPSVGNQFGKRPKVGHRCIRHVEMPQFGQVRQRPDVANVHVERDREFRQTPQTLPEHVDSRLSHSVVVKPQFLKLSQGLRNREGSGIADVVVVNVEPNEPCEVLRNRAGSPGPDLVVANVERSQLGKVFRNRAGPGYTNLVVANVE